MIFCGDIALPNIKITIDIPDDLRRKQWAVNLEGSLIDGIATKDAWKRSKVFNCLDALCALKEQLNIRLCSIANNHIEDYAPVGETIKKLDGIGLAHVGAGNNLSDASESSDIEGFKILAFGWDVIKCPLATANNGGVNPYTKEHVLRTAKKSIDDDTKVICYFHWGYELEAYPLPYDRELAHELIDMGVVAVIGCHAHRVQQIEIYKERPIVYGLGNFLFPHNVFWNGRLCFPDFVRQELAFELKDNDEFIAHWFDFDTATNHLQYIGSERIKPNSDAFTGRAEYTGMTDCEYDEFFSIHRHHKKMIPIFRSNESTFSYRMKSDIVKWRGKAIDLLVKMNLKAKKK